jgi:hypothetical protein
MKARSLYLCLTIFLLTSLSFSQQSNIILQPTMIQDQGQPTLSTRLFFAAGDTVLLKWAPQYSGTKFRIGTSTGNYNLAEVTVSGTSSSFIPSTLTPSLSTGKYYGIITNSSSKTLAGIQSDAAASTSIGYSNEIQFAVESPTAPAATSPRGTTTSGAPLFQWNAIPGVPAYWIICSSTPFVVRTDSVTNNPVVQGANVVWDYIATGTSALYGTLSPSSPFTKYAIPLFPGNTYYYTILNMYDVSDVAFASTTFGGIVNFTYKSEATIAAPNLITPLDSAVIQGASTIRFQWDPVANANSYTVYLFNRVSQFNGTNQSIDLPVWNGSTTNTQLDFNAKTNLYNGKYVWLVIPNTATGAGNASVSRIFNYVVPMSRFKVVMLNSLNSNMQTNYQVQINSTTGGYAPSVPYIVTNAVSLYDSLPSGNYQFTAKKSGFFDSTFTASVNRGTDTTLVILYVRPYPSTVSGGVVDNKGASVSEATVQFINVFTNAVYNATTASAGTFSINLPQGTYKITASKAGYLSPASTTVTVDQGQLTISKSFVLTLDIATISGKTLNDAGSAVQLASVKVSTGTISQEAISDGTGSFSFTLSSGTWTLETSKSGFVSPAATKVILASGDNKTNQNLILTPRANQVTGTVSRIIYSGTQSNLVAYAGVTVTATPTSGQPVSAVTGSNGQYLLNLSSGTFTITVSVTGYTSAGTKQITVTVGQTVSDINFTLTPNPSSAAGVITATGGTSLEGAVISNGTVSTTSLSTGSYLLSLPAGTHILTVTKSNYVTPSTDTIVVNTGQNLSGIDFVMAPNASTITGSVSSLGLTLANATITATKGTQTLTTVTDAKGAFSFSVQAGTYVLVASKSGFISSAKDSFYIGVGQISASHNYTLVENKATISGVVSSGSQVLSGAAISVKQIQDASISFSTSSNIYGEYTVSVPASASYSVTAAATGYSTVTSTTETLAAKAAKVVNVLLNPVPALISGKVTDNKAAAVSKVQVLIYNNTTGTLSDSTTTNLNGEYSIGSLTGTVKLKTKFPGYTQDSIVVTVTLGQTLTGINFTVSPNYAILSGVVTDNNGAKIAGALVTLESSSSGGTANTGTDGSYMIQQLIGDVYRVRVQKSGYESSIISGYSIVDGSAKTLNVTINALIGQISGYVKDSGGNAVQSATVYAVDTVAGKTYSGISDALGVYQISPLPLSGFVVYAQKEKYTSKTQMRTELTTSSVNATVNISDLIKNAAVISGTIKNAAGVGIQGAMVSVSGDGGAASTTTDMNGAFSITELVAGTYTVTVSKTSYVTSTSLHLTDVPFTIQLAASAVKLTGTVLNQAGSALGFTVSVRAVSDQTTLTATSDSTSKFSFENASPNTAYTLSTQIFRSGYTNDDSVFTIPAGAIAYGPIPLKVQVNLSGISGNVGISNATVYVKNTATAAEVTAVSASDGSYTVSYLTNGTFSVTPVKAGYSFSPASTNITLGVAESKSAVFTSSLNAGNLSVTVKDKNSVALANASVTLISSDTVYQYNGLTSTTGAISFTNLPVKSYYFRVGFAGYSDYSKTISITKGVSLTENVVLSKNNSTISGTVKSTAPLSKALVGAAVVCKYPATGRAYDTVSITGGAFIKSNLPSGSALIIASLSGYVSDTINVSFSEAGEVKTNQQLELQPAFANLTGKVLYGSNGLANVTVTAVSSGTYTATTGTDGSFLFSALPIKTGANDTTVYQITISSTDFQSQSKSVSFTNAQLGKDVSMPFFVAPSGKIDVTLTDGNTVLGGVGLTFVRPDGNTTQSITDGKGKFATAAKLTAGTYKLSITKDGYLLPGDAATSFVLSSDTSTINRSIELRYLHTPLTSISAASPATVTVNYNAIASSYQAFLYYTQGSNPEVVVAMTQNTSAKTLSADIPATNSVAGITYYIVIKESSGSALTYKSSPVTLIPEAVGVLASVSYEPAIDNITVRLKDTYSFKLIVKDGKNSSLTDKFNGSTSPGVVSWEVSDTTAFNILTNSVDKTTAGIIPLKTGTYKLTAVVALNGSIVRESATIAVGDISLKSIQVNTPYSIVSNKIQGIQFSYSGTDTSSKTVTLGNSLSWSISPEGAGTIDSTGFFVPVDSTYIGLVTVTASDKIESKKGTNDVLLYADVNSATNTVLTNKQGMSLSITSGSVDFPIQLTLARSQFGPGKKYYAPVGGDVSYVASDKQYIFQYSADRALVDNKLNKTASLVLPVDETLRLFDGEKSIGFYDSDYNEWSILTTTPVNDRLQAGLSVLGEYSILTANEPLGLAHAALLPNPFSPNVAPVKIGYKLNTTKTQAHVTIMVFNVRGDLVRTILKDDAQFPGIYGPDPSMTPDSRRLITWDGKTDDGYEALNGRYIIRIQAKDPTGDVSKILPVVLIK